VTALAPSWPKGLKAASQHLRLPKLGLRLPKVSLSWAIARELFRLRVDKSAARVGLVSLCFAGLFGLIGARLVQLAIRPDEPGPLRRGAGSEISAARPDIVDRNGETLATDVRMVSVFAEPRNIVDKDEAVELLTAVLPDLDARDLRTKLGTRKGFVWVKREITPRQQAEVHRLGIPASDSCRRTSASIRTARRRPTSSASPTSTTSASRAWKSTSTGRGCRTSTGPASRSRPRT
jgi:hypothetical protein